MGYAGKLREKKLAKKLRKTGLSYNEIRKKVKVSKSTLSLWCRDIVLSVEQMEGIRKKSLKGAERGRIIGAKVLQTRRIEKTRKIYKEARLQVSKLVKRDRFIAGIALYAGDGSKGDKAVGFSNSNPRIIKFMIDWFREFGKIPEKKFSGAIWIHDNRDVDRAEKFWSDLTGIPIMQFTKTYIAKNKTNTRKIRKKVNKYGVFAIRIFQADLQRKIKGWMSGVLGIEWYN